MCNIVQYGCESEFIYILNLFAYYTYMRHSIKSSEHTQNNNNNVCNTHMYAECTTYDVPRNWLELTIPKLTKNFEFVAKLECSSEAGACDFEQKIKKK